VRRYDLGSGAKVGPTTTLGPHNTQRTRIAYASDSLLIAGLEGFLWTLRDDGSAPELLASGVAAGPAFTLSRDRKLVMSGAPMTKTQVSVIELAKRRVRRVFEWSLPDVSGVWGAPGVQAVALTREGDRIAMSVPDYGIFLFDAASGAQLGCFAGHASALAFDRSGATLFAAGRAGAVEVWQARLPGQLVQSGNPPRWSCSVTTPAAKLEGHDGEVTDLVVADGAFLASAGADGTIVLWRTP
jgi:WD40 repeat protein